MFLLWLYFSRIWLEPLELAEEEGKKDEAVEL
jgi:hypothetical protein